MVFLLSNLFLAKDSFRIKEEQGLPVRLQFQDVEVYIICVMCSDSSKHLLHTPLQCVLAGIFEKGLPPLRRIYISISYIMDLSCYTPLEQNVLIKSSYLENLFCFTVLKINFLFRTFVVVFSAVN